MPPNIRKPVKQAKISDVIQAQLEEMILDGTLVAGEKLPAERELAKQFEVSRPSLREAIQKLEAKNLVIRRQGGGTFVTDTATAGVSVPAFTMAVKSDKAQLDLLEFRFGMEGISAYYAAKRGTKADIEEIKNRYEQIGNVQLENDRRLEAQAVFEFSVAICAASKNEVMLQLVRGMAEVLINNIEQNLSAFSRQPAIYGQISDYRQRLIMEIISGQPQRAWAVSHAHLSFIAEQLSKAAQEKSGTSRIVPLVKR